jgi:hypothetical protein
MGGSRQPWVNLPGALVVLCGSGVTGCHGWVETHRQDAYGDGWLVRRHGTVLPTEISVPHTIYGQVRLIDDGTTHDQP